MGKNSKQKNKVSLPAPPPTPAADTEADLRPPKRLAILGFAALGLLMGFLWGANSVIDVGQSTSPLIQAARVSLAIATNSANLDQGLGYGFVGLILGASFGYSIFLDPRLMFSSWLAGVVGFQIGVILDSPLLCALGWLVAYGLVIFRAAKVHYAQALQELQAQQNSASQ